MLLVEEAAGTKESASETLHQSQSSKTEDGPQKKNPEKVVRRYDGYAIHKRR